MRRDPLANPAPLIRRVYSYVAYRIGDGPDAAEFDAEIIARRMGAVVRRLPYVTRDEMKAWYGSITGCGARANNTLPTSRTPPRNRRGLKRSVGLK